MSRVWALGLGLLVALLLAGSRRAVGARVYKYLFG